ncbi:hypothetical protein Tco_0766911 [Tanacetum coccineum]
MHNNNMVAGSRDRPPMLAMGRYAQWHSRVALANLIANLKRDVDENKKIQKKLKKANTSLTELQFLFLAENKECECLAKSFRNKLDSVSKRQFILMLFDSFAKLVKYSISLELALQQCQEQMKNDTGCNEKESNVFLKERKQYVEIQDLKAQLQDKNIAISELKKLVKKCKGKSVETKFDKPSVVRQPNAQRIPKPCFRQTGSLSDSFERKSFTQTQSVAKTNVSESLSKPATTQILPQTARQSVRNTNVIKPGMYRIDTMTTQTRVPQLPHTSRNTNPRVSTSTGVIHKTKVSRPQPRSTQMKDTVVPNNSHVKDKKTEVEDHHRISSNSNKTKSVTASNDNLKFKTSNVNAVCATCGKCYRIKDLKSKKDSRFKLKDWGIHVEFTTTQHFRPLPFKKLGPLGLFGICLKIVQQKVVYVAWLVACLAASSIASRVSTARKVVMSSTSSAVTYTSIYTDSKPGRIFWGADEEISDGGPEDPHTPPVLQDEDEREAMFIQPHDPDYVSEPIYPALPPVVLPTAESPGYVIESDPEEDPKEYEDDETEDGPVDYPIDGGEDGDDDDGDSSRDDADDEDKDEWDEDDEDEEEEEEEEEHLALADSVVIVHTVELVSPPEGTEPVIPHPILLIIIGARITLRLQASISIPPEAEVERLLAMPTPPPSPLISLSPPSAGERLARCTAPSTHSSPPPVPSPFLPSSGCPIETQTLRIASTQALVDAVTIALPSPPLPPLPPSLYIPPPVDRRDDISESEQPPRKRSCLFALSSSYEVGESSTARPIGEVGYGIRDTWVDPAEAVPEIAHMTMEEVNTRVTELAELHEHDTQDLYALLEDAQEGRTRISKRVTIDS